MRPTRLVIDGYSLLHRDPATARLLGTQGALARQRLIRDLEREGPRLADQITLVFDGRDGPDEPSLHSTLIEVIFSPSHMTADTVIERLVCAAEDPTTILVVTSDRRERETVAAAGADTVSCGDFLEQLQPPPTHRRDPGIVSRPKPKGPTLGDFFPR